LAGRVTAVTLPVQRQRSRFLSALQSKAVAMNAPPTTGLVRYFLRLGAAGFGGPIALVEHMRRDLVEDRGWISDEEYREGLALAQLSPGPLAAQLCFYLGYVRGGGLGAAASGVAFVLPSFIMVVGLGWAY